MDGRELNSFIGATILGISGIVFVAFAVVTRRREFLCPGIGLAFFGIPAAWLTYEQLMNRMK